MRRWTVILRHYRRRLRRPRVDWALPVALALGAGWLLSAAGGPIPWMMGPLFSSLILAAATGREWAFPAGLRILSQVILGLTVGLTLDLYSVIAAGPTLLGLSVVILLTFSLNMLNGVLLSRWTGVDRGAALLGSVPGAASAIVAMAADFGMDARVVAVLQYLRVLAVAVMIPFVVENVLPAVFPGGMPEPSAADGALAALEDTAGVELAEPGAASFVSAGDLALLVIYGVAGLWVGQRLRLPSPPFLGPFLVAVAGSHLLGAPDAVPGAFFNGALLLLGTWIGLLFDMPMVRKLGRLTVLNLVLLVLLVAATVVLSWLYSLVGGVSLATAFLANAPGAMEVAIAASIKLGAEPPVVVSVQMIRFLVTLFMGAPIAQRFSASGGGGTSDRRQGANGRRASDGQQAATGR